MKRIILFDKIKKSFYQIFRILKIWDLSDEVYNVFFFSIYFEHHRDYLKVLLIYSDVHFRDLMSLYLIINSTVDLFSSEQFQVKSFLILFVFNSFLNSIFSYKIYWMSRHWTFSYRIFCCYNLKERVII